MVFGGRPHQGGFTEGFLLGVYIGVVRQQYA